MPWYGVPPIRSRSVTDDAGKPVTVMNPASGAEWPAEEFRFHALAARLNAIRHHAWSGLAVLGMQGLWALASAVIISGLYAVLRSFLWWLPGWGLFLLLTICYAITMPWTLRSMNRLRAKSIADALLREGVCAACGYNLIDAQPDENGLRVCPECGATWSNHRLERVQPFTGTTFVRFDRFDADRKYWRAQQQVRDATKRVQPLANLRHASRTVKRQAPELVEAIRQGQRDARRSSRPYRWSAALLIVVVALAICYRAWGSGMFSLPQAWIVLFPVGVLALYLLLVGPVTVSISLLARAIARRGVCPACASVLPFEPDPATGLTTCVACLATWNAPAFKVVVPEAEMDTETEQPGEVDTPRRNAPRSRDESAVAD